MRWIGWAFASVLLACANPFGSREPEEDPWPGIFREYDRYLAYKALAVADDGAYGYSYARATPELAVAEALDYCEEYAKAEPSGCRVWALGQRVVDGLSPDRLAEEMRHYSLRVVDGYDRDRLVDDRSRQVPLVRDYFENETR